MQRILVCAQDPVLAKKVRFLMERDECKVEILTASDELEARIQEKNPNLVVLSREIDGEDTINWVTEMDVSIQAPALILGGESRSTNDFVHLVPDPVDTQAIYREATRILQSTRVYSSLPSGEESSESAQVNETNAQTGVDSVMNGITDEINALEDAQLSESNSEAFEPISSPPMENSMHTAQVNASHTPQSSPKLARDQPLDPASLAKALYRVWHEKQSSALFIEQEDLQTTIHFEEGRVIAVSFGHRGDTLGRSLLERSCIDQAQYAEAAIWSVEEGLPLATAIIHLGFLTTDALGKELGMSAKEALVSLFTSQSGRFWLDQESEAPTDERPYKLEVLHIISQGLREKTDSTIIESILGDDPPGYFQLQRPSYELQKDFPLSKTDLQFLSFESRAYRLTDAAENAELPLEDAKRLMAILTVCEEVQPFSPGPKEFEDRIQEELQTRRELESQLPSKNPPPVQPFTDRAPSPVGQPQHTPTSITAEAPPREDSVSFEIHHEEELPSNEEDEPTYLNVNAAGSGTAESSLNYPSIQSSSSPSNQVIAPHPMSFGGGSHSGEVNSDSHEGHTAPIHTSVVTPPPAPVDVDIPPMPVPSDGEGSVPRPLSFAKPLPRGADGALLDTPERVISREHFQNGVNLLGKGNFSSAEECFRDAVSLCSEEHVYLIGLARAIYYNPAYGADGKLPILEGIVERAQVLAPDDKRVSTLAAWVSHAVATFQ